MINHRLANAIKQLKQETANAGAPSWVEAAVKLEFDRVQKRERMQRWSIAACAVAVAVFVLMLVPRPKPASAPTPAPQPNAAAAPEQPFIPIPYVAPPGPYERVEVVRMDLPVAALLSAGLRVETADPSGFAQADVVVGQDGSPRAVRLISIQGQ
jgi:hypothetical protein